MSLEFAKHVGKKKPKKHTSAGLKEKLLIWMPERKKIIGDTGRLVPIEPLPMNRYQKIRSAGKDIPVAYIEIGRTYTRGQSKKMSSERRLEETHRCEIGAVSKMKSLVRVLITQLVDVIFDLWN